MREIRNLQIQSALYVSLRVRRHVPVGPFPMMLICVFSPLLDLIFDWSCDDTHFDFVLHPCIRTTSFFLGLPIYVGALDAYYLLLIFRNLLLTITSLFLQNQIGAQRALLQNCCVLPQLYLFSFTVCPAKVGIFWVYLRIRRIDTAHQDCRFYFGRRHRLHHLHSFIARELKSTAFEIVCPHEHSLNDLGASLVKLIDLDVSNSFLLIFEGTVDQHELISSSAKRDLPPVPNLARSKSLLLHTTSSHTDRRLNLRVTHLDGTQESAVFAYGDGDTLGDLHSFIRLKLLCPFHILHSLCDLNAVEFADLQTIST